jgi:hypothetical protein
MLQLPKLFHLINKIKMMKKLFFALTALAMVAIIACSNGTANNTTNESNSATSEETDAAKSSLTCTIDGASFTAKQFLDKSGNKFSISLAGVGVDKKQAVILFFDRAKTVTGAVFNYKFKMGESAESSVTFRNYTNYDNFEFKDLGFESSTITITKATANRIEGTFIASGKNNNITNGKFSIATQLKW